MAQGYINIVQCSGIGNMHGKYGAKLRIPALMRDGGLLFKHIEPG